ncbi:hypothetical protein ACU4GD_17205, partial [Cupriavidus basilensis]
MRGQPGAARLSPTGAADARRLVAPASRFSAVLGQLASAYVGCSNELLACRDLSGPTASATWRTARDLHDPRAVVARSAQQQAPEADVPRPARQGAARHAAPAAPVPVPPPITLAVMAAARGCRKRAGRRTGRAADAGFTQSGRFG